MKKFLFVPVIFIVLNIALLAQGELRFSMGVSGISTPSLRSYLNSTFAPSQDQVAPFNTAISFAGEYGYQIKKDFQLGLEYDFMLNSFNIPYFNGTYEISYNIHSPSVTAYYVMPGPGYKLKLGGGIGPRFVTLEEKVPPIKASDKYSSTGFGVLVKAEGLTTLGGNFYAYIGGELRADFNGEPKKNGANIINNANNEKVNMNSLSAGLKLGVSYIF